MSRRIALMGETGGHGGAEQMMVLLADELTRRGHEVVPIGPAECDPWQRNQFRALGLTPETFTAGSGADFKCLAQIVGILRRRQVEVVHTHEFLTSVYAGAAARALRLPHVITMHGGRYYAGRAHRRMALRWSARRSRAVVGVSAATAAELAQHLRLPADRVRVVHNGVRARAGDAARVRRELGVGEDELLVLAVGNLYPVKAHAVLLRALARVASDAAAPRWRVAIAGKGGEKEALAQLAARTGIQERVHLLGYRADVPDLLAAADVYAMPSLSEGLPLALVEAMFAGKAAVASAVGGIPEVVTDGVEALLAPPGDDQRLADQLQRVMTDAVLRRRLGTAAKRRATEAFGVERMADEYEHLYGFANASA